MKNLAKLTALLLVCVLFLCGCTTNPSSDNTTTTEPQTTLAPTGIAVNIGVLKGPTGMGAVQLMKKSDDKTSLNSYSFTIAAAPDVITPMLIKGELDMAALPSNAAATLYAKSGDIKVIAINTLGVLYLLQNGAGVSSVADLKGKTIITSGQGTTVEYVLNYILEKNGLKAGTDVTVEYLTEHAEVVAKAASGTADIVLLPEPFVTSLTTKVQDFTVALNITEEWEKTGAGQLPMGVIVARSEFIDANPAAVKAFLSEYSDSVKYVNENTADASQLIGSYEIMTAEVAAKAIPRANMVCITGSEMKAALSSYYAILFESNPKSVGGALPDDAVFYLND